MLFVGDNPIICNYTKNEDAPECGPLGCFGIISPVNVLTPTSHDDADPIYYFDTTNHVCYKSTNKLASDWEIDINGFIEDISLNQKSNALYLLILASCQKIQKQDPPALLQHTWHNKLHMHPHIDPVPHTLDTCP